MTTTLYSGVKQELISATLFKGARWAVFGIVILVASGIWMPPELMTTWGAFLLLIALTLIAWGLLPYRRLTYLQSNPNKLLLEAHMLQYVHRGRICFAVPRSAIAHAGCVPSGIALWLQDPLPEKMTLLQRRFPLSRFIKQSRKQADCDLFFAHFGKTAFREMEEWLET